MLPVCISLYKTVCLGLTKKLYINHLLINITCKPYSIPIFNVQHTVLSVDLLSSPGQNKCLPNVLKFYETKKEKILSLHSFNLLFHSCLQSEKSRQLIIMSPDSKNIAYNFYNWLTLKETIYDKNICFLDKLSKF